MRTWGCWGPAHDDIFGTQVANDALRPCPRGQGDSRCSSLSHPMRANVKAKHTCGLLAVLTPACYRLGGLLGRARGTTSRGAFP